MVKRLREYSQHLILLQSSDYTSKFQLISLNTKKSKISVSFFTYAAFFYSVQSFTEDSCLANLSHFINNTSRQTNSERPSRSKAAIWNFDFCLNLAKGEVNLNLSLLHLCCRAVIVSPVETAPQPFLLPRISGAYADFTSGSTETFSKSSPSCWCTEREAGLSMENRAVLCSLQSSHIISEANCLSPF